MGKKVDVQKKHGVSHPLPRRVQYYAKAGCSCPYKYKTSKDPPTYVEIDPNGYPQVVKEIEDAILGQISIPNGPPDSVNLNFYEKLNDGVSWHGDNEDIIKPAECI